MCFVKQKKTWRGCDSKDSFVTYRNCVVFLTIHYFSGQLTFYLVVKVILSQTYTYKLACINVSVIYTAEKDYMYYEKNVNYIIH